MNQKKAKSLRRALGFHPAAPRDYDTGTIKSTGARRSYQAVKRTPVLTRHVLGAA